MHILCEEKWKGLEIFSQKKKKKNHGVRLGVLSVSYFARPATKSRNLSSLRYKEKSDQGRETSGAGSDAQSHEELCKCL